MDTILCRDKEDAKKAIDNLPETYIKDWEFLPDGKVKIYMLEGWRNAV